MYCLVTLDSKHIYPGLLREKSPMSDVSNTTQTEEVPLVPVPKKVEHIREYHGDTFIDHYEWMRDKENQEVLDYLNAEADYTAAVTADQQPLRERIFEEIKSRTLLTDLTVPNRIGDWWYYSRMVPGGQYPIFYRYPALHEGDEVVRYTPPVIKPGEPLEGESVVLDCNDYAKDMEFFALGVFQPSRNGKLLSISVDEKGDERYEQRFLNLETGEFLPDTIPNISGGSFFINHAQQLVYTVPDDSWRPYRVYVHDIGAGTEDHLIYEETDPTMWLGSAMSADRSSIVLSSGNSEFTEVSLVPIAEPKSTPRVIIPRDARIEYQAEPITIAGETHLLIQHDYKALNSELVLADMPKDGESLEEYSKRWVPVIRHSENVRLEGFTLSATHLVVTARADTTTRLFLAPREQLPVQWRRKKPAGITFMEPAGFDEELYTAGVLRAENYSPVIRIAYTSFLTPRRVYDYFPMSQTLLLRRETPVLGGYQREDYRAYRDWAPAADGTLIPISVIHRADLDLTQPHPVLQYAYGSYEISMDPMFSIPTLSILDRGVVYVIAHIRGGGEMGRTWYLNGKKLHKKNSFTDFVDVTDYLATKPWADPARIACYGGSAGGLLMGAVLNLAPEKYAVSIAQVPFVDALTTILDPDLPLSALEWEEWGNPIEDKEVYEYMKSYTPYENIRPVRYPAIAAVTSLHDTRVFYVEPAKWIAKLRETIDPSSPTPLLKIDMTGGHGGGSGRYTRWREIAWDYAFILTHLGITK